MHKVNYNHKFLGAAFLGVAITCIISVGLFMSAVGSGNIADSITTISAKSMQIQLSIFFDLITSFGIIILGVLLYEALKKQNGIIALVALGMYIAESITLAISKIGTYSLLSTSLQFVKTGEAHSLFLKNLITIIFDAERFGYNVHMLFFCIGALMFYYLFFRSKIIPVWLSIWGLTAVSLCLIGTLLVMFFDIKILVMILPNVLFEIFIGIWLIAKDFTSEKQYEGKIK